MVSRQNEDDAAWRSIVENYGERAELDPAPSGAEPETANETAYDDLDDVREVDALDDWDDRDDDHFVPPPPPPLPHPTPVRLAAWLGVFGAPALLLLDMVLALPLPGWLAKALVAWFVGGFVYLVFHMDRGPRDPWDNGARV
jgi:hypothetical protein